MADIWRFLRNHFRIDQLYRHHPQPTFGQDVTEPDRDSTSWASRNVESVGSRAASSAALLFATNQILRVLQLITLAVLARILSPADYGLIAVAMTVIGLLEVVSNLQLGGSIIRIQNLESAHLDTMFTIGLLRAVGFALSLIGSAHLLALWMEMPKLEAVLYVLALSTLIGGFQNPYFMLFERDLNFRQESFRTAIGNVVGSAVGIATAIILRSYWALVASSMAISIVSLFLSYHGVQGRPKWGFSKWRDLVGFGVWMMLINVMNYINGKLDYFIVGRFLGPSKLGAYHIGQQVTLMATGDIVSPVSRALFPALSMIANDPDRFRAGYRRAQAFMLFIALPAGLGVSVLAKDIVLVLVGKGWDAAIPVIQFLAPLIALQTLSASIEAVAMAMGQGRALFVRTFLFLIVRGVVMVVGFFLGGFMGIIYARIVSGSFYLISGLLLAGMVVQGRWYEPLLSSWRCFIAGAAMVAAIWLLPAAQHDAHIAVAIVELAGKILLGALVYVTFIFSLWKVAGKPDGPETRALFMLQSLLGRWRGGRQPIA